MCDVCVMNAVKDRMLSRRSFFPAGAMATTAAALGSVAAAPQALAAGHGQVVDMTHALHDAFPTCAGALPANRYGIECLANLDQMPASGATLFVGAPKVSGGTGGQARIFAMV